MTEQREIELINHLWGMTKKLENHLTHVKMHLGRGEFPKLAQHLAVMAASMFVIGEEVCTTLVSYEDMAQLSMDCEEEYGGIVSAVVDEWMDAVIVDASSS
jgi:hypothetical protein